MVMLNEVELQNLRHLIGAHDTVYAKMSAYAEEATSPEIKQYFEKAGLRAKQTKDQLMNYLQ